MQAEIHIEIFYATLREQKLLSLLVPIHTTIVEAIEFSGILHIFPEIDLRSQAVGVFGKVRALSDKVSAGERIEIYRPLVIDPKQARRMRAAKR